MVRRKIEIKPIEDKFKRHTSFTKRRQGLMNKIEEFCNKSDSSAAAIVFSNAGNAFIFGHPDINAVLERYEADCSSPSAAESGIRGVERREHVGDRSEDGEMRKRIGVAVETGRWEEVLRGLDSQKLDELFAEVEYVRSKVVAREMLLAMEDKQGSGSSGGDSNGGG